MAEDPIWSCGTPSRSCASSAATDTSRCWSSHGLSGLEALVTHAATGEVPGAVLRSTRGWSERRGMRRSSRCAAGVGSRQGDQLRFTEWGATQRQEIEEGTDALAAAPYDVLGEERCAELRALVRPWSTVFAEHLR